MANIERMDFWIMVVALLLIIMLLRLRPSVEDIHSLVEMANTKGGIILVLWLTSMLFFMAGIRLAYWTVGMTLAHPGDPAMAILNTAFNWVSGSAFGGAFGAMVATMKGEALPANGNGKTPPPAPTVESKTVPNS